VGGAKQSPVRLEITAFQIIADFTLADADAENATRSLDIEPLGSWWRQAVKEVRIFK
jgi:hypothetical protein